MGIYINMEMPINCEKCIYSAWSNFYQIYVCNAVRKNEPVLFDGKQTESTAVVRSARADNCPLVPVPPHGRLIDADELLMHRFVGVVGEAEKSSYMVGWNSAIEAVVENARTVIPAEEGER